MAIITALTAQKRNKARMNVFLDDVYAFSLADIVAARLRVGQELSQAEIAAIQGQDEVEKARENVLRLLTYRPRSIAEVKRRLREKGFGDDAVEQAVERLEAVQLLDDYAFTQYWIEQRETFKPRSRIALRQELQQKGIERALIETLLADVDETAAARRAANKQSYRWAQLPEDEFKVKLGRYLQQRGFPYDIIREIMDETWQSLAETDTDQRTSRHEGDI